MITNTYVITYYCYVSGYLIYSFVIIQELKEVSIYSISVTSTCTCISWQSIFRSFYFGSQYFLEVEEIKDPQGFVGVWHQIQIYLNLYFWVKFIKGIPSENHQPAKSPWQPHQNKVVLNTSIMCWNQNVNSCGVMHWLYVCRYLPMDNVNSYGVMHWLYVCRYLPMDNVNSYGVIHWLYVCRYLPMDNVNSYGVMHWLYVCRYLPMDKCQLIWCYALTVCV
jgi:hypothetical protein